ncbi:coiled-coil domain-containing protein 80-like [Arapaima gigas]
MQSLLILLLLLLWTCSADLSAAARRSPIQMSPLRERKAKMQGVKQSDAPTFNLVPELAFLADLADQKRLWVIAAPSHDDNYLRMMKHQIQDMEAEGLSCQLVARETLILIIIHNAMMEGILRRPSAQGATTEELLDPDAVSKLVHHLELPDQAFAMVLLKRNLQVSERFPYPVRVEAVLEAIDQLPLRKLETLTGRVSRPKCKVHKRKGWKKGFGTLRKGHVTLLVPRPLKNLDKQAVKNKVHDILSGRRRFVIRKSHSGRTTKIRPAGGATNMRGIVTPQGERPNSQDTAAKLGVRRPPAKSSGSSEGDKSSTKSKSTKKQKGRKKDGKRKKGKGKEKKPQQDSVEKERNVVRGFLEKLCGKTRLLVVSAPSEDAPQLKQQTAENEQYRCELAARTVSILTILGSTNTNLSLQHYTSGAESSEKSVTEEFTNEELISQLRGDYGLPTQGFSMVLTDYDLRSQKVFKAPVTSPVLMAYIDSLPSRQTEIKKEKTTHHSCSWLDPLGGTESSLLRFVSKRRLLVISGPSQDDHSFQQQLQALSSQTCPLGIRHFALIKLVGAGLSASGSLELFPLNGKSPSENELLTHDTVNGLREKLKIHRDYFSMVVVDKGGKVEAWFPTPLWSLSNVYDLVDSTEQRQQELKLQRALGIHCPEEGNGGSEYGGKEG